jgi:gluconolactonase
MLRTMSSIIPVDLLAFATNPSYLNTLLTTTNTSGTGDLALLAYHDSFYNVVGEQAGTRQLYDFSD